MRCQGYFSKTALGTRLKKNILIMFDDFITDMIREENNSVVTKLFIKNWKLNISLEFTTQSNFPIPKDVTERDFLKLLLTSHLKLTLMNLRDFTESIQHSHTCFWSLMPLFPQSKKDKYEYLTGEEILHHP